MLFTKTQSILLALAAARSAFAHTCFTTLYVDGVDQVSIGTIHKRNHHI